MTQFKPSLSLKQEKLKIKYSRMSNLDIIPIWEISNPKLYPPYNESWDLEDQSRFHIFPSVLLETIFKYLHDSYLKIFRTPGFFKDGINDKKVCGILDRWENSLPIDPPTISWDTTTKKMIVENGINRINTAVNLKVSKIPILVSLDSYYEISNRI